MLPLCLSVASPALSASRLVCVVLLANRRIAGAPILLWYHTLLSSAVISKGEVAAWARPWHVDRKGQPYYIRPHHTPDAQHRPVYSRVDPCGQPGAGSCKC